MMKKTIAAASIALTLAGAGFAFAQQAQQAQQTPRGERGGARFSTEDVVAFTDARIAGLKAGLKLTAEQDKNWPAVETAIRDLAKARADGMKARAERREARRAGGDNAQRPERDAIARLRQGADAMTTRAAGVTKLADAAEPLYKSLDDGQKRRFAVLLHMTGGHVSGGRHSHWQRRADNNR